MSRPRREPPWAALPRAELRESATRSDRNAKNAQRRRRIGPGGAGGSGTVTVVHQHPGGCACPASTRISPR